MSHHDRGVGDDRERGEVEDHQVVEEARVRQATQDAPGTTRGGGPRGRRLIGWAKNTGDKHHGRGAVNRAGGYNAGQTRRKACVTYVLMRHSHAFCGRGGGCRRMGWPPNRTTRA